MIQMFLAFCTVFAVFWFGIPAFRNLSGKGKWDLTLLFFYSIMCALLAIGLLITIVVLF
jgi:hypothetical protein